MSHGYNLFHLNRKENDNESDPVRFLSSFMGERRELNPRVVDSQSTALVHLATSAPEKPIYLSTVISSKNKKSFLPRIKNELTFVLMWVVGDL